MFLFAIPKEIYIYIYNLQVWDDVIVHTLENIYEKNQWRTEGGRVWGGWNHPPPEIPKAHQNRAKLNPIVKTVKNCWI